jgi:hypothetical protein
MEKELKLGFNNPYLIAIAVLVFVFVNLAIFS